MRRIAAVLLPYLRIEMIRHQNAPHAPEEKATPLALVVATHGGAVTDERTLLGNTRIDEVSKEARALGITKGQTIASARAKSNELTVRVVRLEEIRSVLIGIAEALFQFGPTTSFDLESNTVWVDISGTAHLHAHEHDSEGELTLARKIVSWVRAMKHTCRVAVAGGPTLAKALAMHGSFTKSPILLLSSTDPLPTLNSLPIRALPVSPKTHHWLSKLGMSTIGDVARLPPRSLGPRLGAESSIVSAFLSGRDLTPLRPHQPAEIPEESATLEYGIETSDALLFVAKTLCDRMERRFLGRGIGTSALELIVKLDRALAKEAPLSILSLSVSAVLSEAHELLAILKARIESFQIQAPILEVTLRATKIVKRTAVPQQLFHPEPKALRMLPRLTAELEAELGPSRVGTLVLENCWLMAERSRLVPYGSAQHDSPPSLPIEDSPQPRFLSGAPEPSRILRTPQLIREPLHPIIVSRLESIEWWKTNIHTSRDQAVTWISSLSSVGFIELDRKTNNAWLTGWLD